MKTVVFGICLDGGGACDGRVGLVHEFGKQRPEFKFLEQTEQR